MKLTDGRSFQVARRMVAVFQGFICDKLKILSFCFNTAMKHLLTLNDFKENILMMAFLLQIFIRKLLPCQLCILLKHSSKDVFSIYDSFV